MSGSRLRNIHKLMVYRCTNPKYDKYNYYGGRGIDVDDEWKNSFETFEDWALNNGYAEGLTLDRIDNNSGYGPDNCRWVTMKEQANNKSTSHMLTYNGKTQTIQKWSEELGISATMLEQRIRAGWDVERALTEEYHDTHTPCMITYKGITKRLHEWAKELGMDYNTLQSRIFLHHWSIEKAIETPVRKR